MGGIDPGQRQRVAERGSSARGGRIVIEGDASLRAGISLKGAHAGHRRRRRRHDRLHGPGRHHPDRRQRRSRLGDSLYEAVIYVQGPSPRSAPTPWSRR